jgi:hypothetical protein
MPYLHWDIQSQHENRQSIMTQSGQQSEEAAWTRDQRFLNTYLYRKHQVHVRRSLDQYYYYTLKDTWKRDRDQVVSRYQEGESVQLKVLTVVDQLWLWVLPGAGDRSDTVISCFPHRDIQEKPNDPDEKDFTNVLSHIKFDLLSNSHSINSIYDLAQLIVGRCSRAYLETRSMKRKLQFREIYENTIGNIVSSRYV